MSLIFKKSFLKALLCGGLFVLVACANTSYIGSGEIVAVHHQSVVADTTMLASIAKDFYQSHPDDYDMLVIWGAKAFAPGHAFYLPVKNDVPGIGYKNVGEEFFNNSTDFGSQQLQGIIWMGPDWISNTDHSAGPRSVLGILAQETGHRWAATLHFLDADLNNSSALLEDAYHWNLYLNTGASPMGGNLWESLGDGEYQATPVDHIQFCPLDLYTMGLITANEVSPLELLVNVHSLDVPANNTTSKNVTKVSEPMTVMADVMEITVDQIISAEGERDPNVGFNAKTIRQAWIYVYQDWDEESLTAIRTLESLQMQWSDYFSDATQGLSVMSANL